MVKKAVPETKPAATEMATALDRWTGEGGAPATPVGESAEAGRQRMLLRLGMATMEEWERLPTGAQRAIFRRASGDATDTPSTMLELARFLHEGAAQRSGDAADTTRADAAIPQA